jgi:short-subunit dehydrogenase
MRDEFINTNFETCRYMMNTNCMAPIAVTKAFLPGFIERKKGQFVNIISIAGLIGTGYRSLYCAAKFGISGFFKSLRSEVRQHGVHVTNVYPEFVKTNISKNALLG